MKEVSLASWGSRHRARVLLQQPGTGRSKQVLPEKPPCARLCDRDPQLEDTEAVRKRFVPQSGRVLCRPHSYKSHRHPYGPGNSHHRFPSNPSCLGTVRF